MQFLFAKNKLVYNENTKAPSISHAINGRYLKNHCPNDTPGYLYVTRSVSRQHEMIKHPMRTFFEVGVCIDPTSEHTRIVDHFEGSLSGKMLTSTIFDKDFSNLSSDWLVAQYIYTRSNFTED